VANAIMQKTKQKKTLCLNQLREGQVTR